MKSFKKIFIAVSAIYLLSITACRNNRVEVIQGSINAVSKVENNNEFDYSSNGLVGFNGMHEV